MLLLSALGMSLLMLYKAGEVTHGSALAQAVREAQFSQGNENIKNNGMY